jgi:CHASE3 domain sensor protein
MKVRHQLLLSYLFISLLGILAGLLGFKAIQDSHQKFDQVINETIRVKNELTDLQKSINDFVLCTNEIIFLKQKQQEESVSNQSFSLAKKREHEIIQEINDWHSDKNDYITALSQYEKLVFKFFPEEREYLLSIKKSSQKVLQISKDLINLRQENYADSAIILQQQSLEQADEEFNKIIEAALSHEDIELKNRTNILYFTLNQYRNGILSFTALSLLLAVAIAFLLSHYILKSLEKLKVGEKLGLVSPDAT